MARLQDSLLGDIAEQMRSQGRRPFRGAVAVDLALELPLGRHGAELRPIVKAYLDVLGISAFFDDAMVEHLIVSRKVSTDGACRVRVRCLPLRSFGAAFDRSFRIEPELQLAPPDLHPGRKPWGLRGFDHNDGWLLSYEERTLKMIEDIDCQEQIAFEEDPEDSFLPEVSEPELADKDVRDQAAFALASSIALSLGRKVTDQGFDARDRPGGSPAWLQEVIADDLADVGLQGDEHPGCFSLPPPPGKHQGAGQSWGSLVAEQFGLRYGAPTRWGAARFGEPLALDISIRGGAAPRTDIDNLAHEVIKHFLKVFRSAEPRVDGYRVYRVQFGEPGVRVRVLPIVRLQLLRDSLRLALDALLTERSERRRS
jgi:hypothetical protein